MQVVTSSLTIRFYTRDGWSISALMGLIADDSKNKEILFQEGECNNMSYYIAGVGTSFDIPKLMGLVTKVERFYIDKHSSVYASLSDEEYLKQYNW